MNKRKWQVIHVDTDGSIEFVSEHWFRAKAIMVGAELTALSWKEGNYLVRRYEQIHTTNQR